MNDSVSEFYCGLDRWLRRFSYMNLARWKLIQQTAISALVVVLALRAGADPTVALGVLAILNGISFADLVAVWNNPENPQPDDENKKS